MRRTIPAAVLGLAATLAATALAAQPQGPGTYGGSFKTGKGYVGIHAEKDQDIEVVDSGNVQYQCKGKAVFIASPTRFKPARISRRGRFVVEFSGSVRDEHAKKIGGRARVRITGRFRTPQVVRGVARVKSKRCGLKAHKYTAHGPQVEG